ncbi:MAG: iron ABC transporter permease [Candidatus Caldarchaeum sp.]|uniref:Iron ABC transporter permease n=1 Tax=Caldiarchaeum subterraneum TaxID=311458 RepID=A0A7J3VSG4_CALS0
MLLKAPTIVSIAFLSFLLFPVLLLTSTTSLSVLFEELNDPFVRQAIINTYIYGGGGALVAVFLGGVYAWFVNRTDLPAKYFFHVATLLPLTVPMVVKAISWIFLFSPRIGLVNVWYQQTFNTEAALFNIYTMPGLIFALGVGGIPLAYLTMSSAFNAIDSSFEEASLISGAGKLRTTLRITMGVARPAILSAFLLLFLIGIMNFDYPFILGTPARIETLATIVYDYIKERVPPSYSAAINMSVVYLLITLVVMSLYLWSTRKLFRFATVTGKMRTQTVFNLGRWRFVGVLVCGTIIGLSFVLPFAVVLLVSLMPYYTVKPDMFAVLTIDNYIKLFQQDLFWVSIRNSFMMSTTTGLVATFLSITVSYAILRSKSNWTRILEYLSVLPLSYPGVVYSLALLWMFLTIPVFSTYLYGTLWALVFALLVVWLPYSTRIVSSAMVQVSSEIEEAADIMGAGWLRKTKDVLIPLLRRSMLNSFSYVFINSFRELGAVSILVTSGSYVLTMYISDLLRQSAASLTMIAAISTFTTLSLALLAGVFNLLARKTSVG